MDMEDQFKDLEDWTLKNVKMSRRKIGSGAYGTVEEVEIDGVLCAAKRLYPVLQYSQYSNDDQGVTRTRERFVQECIIMSKLRHPHIVQFLGVFFPSFEDQKQQPSDQRTVLYSPPPIVATDLPWLVMEYLPYTLDHILEKYQNVPVYVKVSFLHGIAKGLLYLHNKGIFHRDLSARNVLITSGMEAKIADFGVSRLFKTPIVPVSSIALTTAPGNSLYMPPEADHERSRGNASYGNTIDIFSFGVIILFTITQSFPCTLLPFTYVDPSQPYRVIGRTEVERRSRYFEMAEGNSKSEEDQRLIQLSRDCLQNNPSSRPNTKVVLGELLYIEQSLMNKGTSRTAEIWRKDKLELVMILEEKQREFDDQQQQKLYSVSRSNLIYFC